MRERLIELIWNAPKVDVVYGDIKIDPPVQTVQTIADYLLANGVIVPPCKVGDKVYQVCNNGRIYESTIINVIYETTQIAFDESAIGKTVFLTREEAEQALKGGEV